MARANGLADRCVSKKKRERKELKASIVGFASAVKDTLEEVRDFIYSATPFEISSELALLGVSTTGRVEVEHFLKIWTPSPSDPDLTTPYEALAEKWILEVEKKNREIDFDDDVFMTEVARFFWLRLNKV